MKRLLIMLLLLLTILIGGCIDGIGFGVIKLNTEIHGEEIDEYAPMAFVIIRSKDKVEGKK